MQKLRILLASTAISLAVSGAVTSTKRQACTYYPQYYRYLDSYVYAGVQGVDYFCISTPVATCTYYKPYPWSPYTPCQSGLLIPIIW